MSGDKTWQREKTVPSESQIVKLVKEELGKFFEENGKLLGTAVHIEHTLQRRKIKKREATAISQQRKHAVSIYP